MVSHVHLGRFGLGLELLPDSFADLLLRIIKERKGRRDRHDVGHLGERAEGRLPHLLTDLLQKVDIRDGIDVDAVPPGHLEDPFNRVRQAVDVELGVEALTDVRFDRGDVLDGVVPDGRVVDYRTVLADLPGVPYRRLVVEGRQHVYRVHVGPDDVLAQPDPEVAVLTLDVRVVLPVPVDLQASLGGRLCKDVSGGIDPASLGATNHPRKIVTFQPNLPENGARL